MENSNDKRLRELREGNSRRLAELRSNNANRLEEISNPQPSQVCPVCGKRKTDVKDRMLVRGYIPGQADNSHIVSCSGCYNEIESEGMQ